MKVKFVLNVPETLALQDPSGMYNVEQEEVSYPTVDGRILTLPTLAAERLNALFLQPGETFGICRSWDKNMKGSIPRFDFWLSPASEQARAAVEIAQQETFSPLNEIAPRKRGKLRKMPEPTQPQLWDGRGTGTYGPAQRPAIAAAGRPQRIPYNVAFREVVQFVTAALQETGEQWSDGARQDMVSTAMISATQQGWLQLWERNA